LGQRSVATELINRSEGITVTVIDAEHEPKPTHEFVEPTPQTAVVAKARQAGTLGRILTPQRIIIWEDAASRQDVRQQLVGAITTSNPKLSAEVVLDKLAQREGQGSTFLNEGIALPHARIEGLESPEVALGLTHGGVLDVPTERPIEAVFLLLSPASGASVHLQLLAKVGRALQSRELRKALTHARTPREALDAIDDFESAASGKTAGT
jgi:two-component system sensor histidine kinase KdpD